MDGAALVAEHGMVLQSAWGPIANLPELVVGEPITGSWWAHPDHDRIFVVLNQAASSPDIVRLRLVRRKLTLVHRRLWPPLVRLAAEIGADRLAAITEEHTATGAHHATEVPFPTWVPADVVAAGGSLDPEEARALLPSGCLPSGA